VAEEVAPLRFGDAGDVAPSGKAGANLLVVIDPANVIGAPVSCLYRLGEDATLIRPEEPKRHIHLATFATTPA
jgi:hypothetical protein